MNGPAKNEPRLLAVGIVAAALVLGVGGFVLYRAVASVWRVPSTSSKIPPAKAEPKTRQSQGVTAGRDRPRE